LHDIHVNKTLASFSHAPIIQIIIAPPFLEKTFRLLNPGSVDGGLSTKKGVFQGESLQGQSPCGGASLIFLQLFGFG
jgi:hypothetical protein